MGNIRFIGQLLVKRTNWDQGSSQFRLQITASSQRTRHHLNIMPITHYYIILHHITSYYILLHPIIYIYYALLCFKENVITNLERVAHHCATGLWAKAKLESSNCAWLDFLKPHRVLMIRLWGMLSEAWGPHRSTWSRFFVQPITTGNRSSYIWSISYCLLSI